VDHTNYHTIDFSLYPDFPTNEQRQKRIRVKSQIGFLYNKSKTMQDEESDESIQKKLDLINEDLKKAEEKLSKLVGEETPDHERIKRAE